MAICDSLLLFCLPRIAEAAIVSESILLLDHIGTAEEAKCPHQEPSLVSTMKIQFVHGSATPSKMKPLLINQRQERRVAQRKVHHHSAAFSTVQVCFSRTVLLETRMQPDFTN